MIITLDTGILVRAVSRSGGPAGRLIKEIASNPEHKLVVSSLILGELGQVLAYSALAKLLKMTATEIHGHLESVRAMARLVEPGHGLPVVLSDPDDDHVVYTAVNAKADVLCTRDRHFYSDPVPAFCRQNGIEVMDDVELLKRLRR